MRNRYASVACGGMDVHYKSSHVTFRDADGKVVARERLDHANRAGLREQLARWPKGVPIVLEASFGWGWLSDLMEEVGLDPQLSNCYKVEQNRRARGQVKTNKPETSDGSRTTGSWRRTRAWRRTGCAPAPLQNSEKRPRGGGGLDARQPFMNRGEACLGTCLASAPAMWHGRQRQRRPWRRLATSPTAGQASRATSAIAGRGLR